MSLTLTNQVTGPNRFHIGSPLIITSHPPVFAGFGRQLPAWKTFKAEFIAAWSSPLEGILSLKTTSEKNGDFLEVKSSFP